MMAQTTKELYALRKSRLQCIRCTLPARTIRSDKGERIGIHCEDCNAYQLMHVRRIRPLKRLPR